MNLGIERKTEDISSNGKDERNFLDFESYFPARKLVAPVNIF
jgi:hypothetical protein